MGDNTPPPSAEVYVMIGIIVLALLIVLVRCLINRCTKPELPKPREVVTSTPPISTVLTISVLPCSPDTSPAFKGFDPCGRRPLELVRDDSNLSQIYYSTSLGPRQHTWAPLLSELDPRSLTPVEEATSDYGGSRASSSCQLEDDSEEDSRQYSKQDKQDSKQDKKGSKQDCDV